MQIVALPLCRLLSASARIYCLMIYTLLRIISRIRVRFLFCLILSSHVAYFSFGCGGMKKVNLATKEVTKRRFRNELFNILKASKKSPILTKGGKILSSTLYFTTTDVLLPGDELENPSHLRAARTEFMHPTNINNVFA